METPYLAPLGLFFLLWISDEEEKNEICRRPSNENSY